MPSEKGTIGVVNGRKRALLTRCTDNKGGTVQSTLCMDNKKDKTELNRKPCVTDIKKIYIFVLFLKAGRYFIFLKRTGCVQKGTGCRAQQTRPKQNTDIPIRTHTVYLSLIYIYNLFARYSN